MPSAPGEGREAWAGTVDVPRAVEWWAIPSRGCLEHGASPGHADAAVTFPVSPQSPLCLPSLPPCLHFPHLPQ